MLTKGRATAVPWKIWAAPPGHTCPDAGFWALSPLPSQAAGQAIRLNNTHPARTETVLSPAAVEADSQPAAETCHWTAPHPSFCRQQGGGSGFGAVTGSSRAHSTRLCNYIGPRVTAGHGLKQAAGGTGTCGSTQEAKGSKAGICSGLSRKHMGVRPEGIQTRANARAVHAQRPARV